MSTNTVSSSSSDINTLIRDATNAKQTSISHATVLHVKLLARTSDSNCREIVEFCFFGVLRHSLYQIHLHSHARTRLLSLLLLEILISRSSLTRRVVFDEKIQNIVIGCFGSSHEAVAGPPATALYLRQEAIRLIDTWFCLYGHRHKRLRVTHEYLTNYHSVHFLSVTVIQVPPQSYSSISPTITSSTNDNIRMQSPSVHNDILREQKSNVHEDSETTYRLLLTKYDRILLDIESLMSSSRLMLIELSTCCDLLIQATTTDPITINKTITASDSIASINDFDIDWPLNCPPQPFLGPPATPVEPKDVKLLVGVLREKSTQLQRDSYSTLQQFEIITNSISFNESESSICASSDREKTRLQYLDQLRILLRQCDQQLHISSGLLLQNEPEIRVKSTICPNMNTSPSNTPHTRRVYNELPWFLSAAARNTTVPVEPETSTAAMVSNTMSLFDDDDLFNDKALLDEKSTIVSRPHDDGHNTTNFDNMNDKGEDVQSTMQAATTIIDVFHPDFSSSASSVGAPTINKHGINTNTKFVTNISLPRHPVVLFAPDQRVVSKKRKTVASGSVRERLEKKMHALERKYR